MINIGNKFDEGIDIMHQATRVIGDINETDKGVMKDLKTQTEALTETTKQVQDANEYYSRSTSVIRNMTIKVFTNKLVLYSIIILLGLLIIFIFYIKIKYKILGDSK